MLSFTGDIPEGLHSLPEAMSTPGYSPTSYSLRRAIKRPHFSIDIRHICNGIGNLGSQKPAVPLPQSMDCNFHRAECHPEPFSCLAASRFIAGQTCFEHVELLSFAVGLEIGPQRTHGPSDHFLGPFPIEARIGVRRLCPLQGIAYFGFKRVQLHEGDAPATFPSLGTMTIVRQEMLHGTVEIRAEATALGIRAGKPILLDEPRQKGLRQILSIARGIATAAHEDVQGVPISPAELLERMTTLGTAGAIGLSHHHQTPVRRGELSGTVSSGILHTVYGNGKVPCVNPFDPNAQVAQVKTRARKIDRTMSGAARKGLCLLICR